MLPCSCEREKIICVTWSSNLWQIKIIHLTAEAQLLPLACLHKTLQAGPSVSCLCIATKGNYEACQNGTLSTCTEDESNALVEEMQNKHWVFQTNNSTPALTSVVAHDEVDVRSKSEGSEVGMTHKVLQGDALYNPRIALTLERNVIIVYMVRVSENNRHSNDDRSVTFMPARRCSASLSSSTVSSSSAFRARLVGWSIPDVLALFDMTTLGTEAKESWERLETETESAPVDKSSYTDGNSAIPNYRTLDCHVRQRMYDKSGSAERTRALWKAS